MLVFQKPQVKIQVFQLGGLCFMIGEEPRNPKKQGKALILLHTDNQIRYNQVASERNSVKKIVIYKIGLGHALAGKKLSFKLYLSLNLYPSTTSGQISASMWMRAQESRISMT